MRKLIGVLLVVPVFAFMFCLMWMLMGIKGALLVTSLVILYWVLALLAAVGIELLRK